MCERKPATKHDWRNTQYELYAMLPWLRTWVISIIHELMY